MRLKPVALSLMLTSLSLPAWAAVEVTYTNPEGYADVKVGAGPVRKQREMVLRELKKHLEKLGAESLPAGDTLKIEVLDINLAGRDQPFNTGNPDQRLLDEVNWPSIRLRYVLERGGQAVAQAEEQVSDKDYLDHSALGGRSDPLRYEKKMLSEWFRDRFGAAAAR
ncbi:MAG: DUF3016 domain-containing protein [Sphingomonadales bacterium]